MPTIYYHDIDVYGREKTDGTPYELNNEEAVKNAVILWITSKAGDFLRNPEAGGLLDRVLFKNMHGRSIGLFLFALKNALINEFSPSIKILDTQVERIYEYRTLKIHITYLIVASNIIQKVEVFTKDIKSIDEQKEQTVTYTGANLRMFCLIRVPNMNNELLIYNEEEDKWRWGIYYFQNFSTEDPYYDEIISICNG